MSLGIEVVGLTEWIERLEIVPRLALAEGALTAAMAAAFEETQTRVHVITGALKNSGKYDSTFDGAGWVGKIVYGGPSEPKDVDYAIYEMRRGGDHDFMSGVPGLLSRSIPVAMEAIWR